MPSFKKDDRVKLSARAIETHIYWPRGDKEIKPEDRRGTVITTPKGENTVLVQWDDAKFPERVGQYCVQLANDFASPALPPELIA